MIEPLITRLEHRNQGNNPCFVVTDLRGSAKDLYDHVHGRRRKAENRIKEAQLELFGAWASGSRIIDNPTRLLMAALARTLLHRLQTLALQATGLNGPARPPSACACSRSAPC